MIYGIITGIWLAGLALVLVFNYGAHKNDVEEPTLDTFLREREDVHPIDAHYDQLEREKGWRR